MCTNNIFNEHMCVHTCMWLKECCAMNTLATENVHWEQVPTGKILLLDVWRGSNKTINLQIYKSYVDASEKNKGMSYNLWNPSEHIKESETEEGTRTKRQEGKKKTFCLSSFGKTESIELSFYDWLSWFTLTNVPSIAWHSYCYFYFPERQVETERLQYPLRNILFILGRVHLPNYKPTWLIRLFLEWGPSKVQIYA